MCTVDKEITGVRDGIVIQEITDSCPTMTFEVGDTGFMIDIVDDLENDSYEAWLYHRGYGVKDMMIGMPKTQGDFRMFTSYVSAHIDCDMCYYQHRYMDEG